MISKFLRKIYNIRLDIGPALPVCKFNAFVAFSSEE